MKKILLLLLFLFACEKYDYVSEDKRFDKRTEKLEVRQKDGTWISEDKANNLDVKNTMKKIYMTADMFYLEEGRYAGGIYDLENFSDIEETFTLVPQSLKDDWSFTYFQTADGTDGKITARNKNTSKVIKFDISTGTWSEYNGW